MSQKVIKKTFFLAQEARSIAKEFNSSLEACYEGLTDENLMRLQYSIDIISMLLCIPNIAEAIIKKSGIDLSIQLDMLSKKIKMWEESDSKDNLRKAISHFFSVLLKVENLTVEISAKKMQEHVANQEFQKVSMLETITCVLKRVSSPLSIENALKAFKIYLSYQEYMRKSGDNKYPDYLNRAFLTKTDILKSWEDLIFASFISIKYLQNNNSAYIRLIDILIFICSLGDCLRLEIVQQGGIRVLLQKLKEDNNLTSDSARKSLTLLRDLCYKDSSTASLMGHHEIEENMMIVLKKFRGDREIENLVSQTLEQTIFGFDLDLENFQDNILQALNKLKEYSAKSIGEEEIDKAQNNIQIIYFYSLMQVFARKLISLKVHDLLYDIIKKELDLSPQILKDNKVFEEHERILTDALIILKRVLQLPETAQINKNKKDNVPSELVNNLMPNLILVIKWKTEMKEVIVHALDCLKVFANNENTKQGAIKLAVQSNITEQLTIIKDIYKDDFKIVKTVNNLYFLFAKVVGDFANSLQKNSIVSNLVKQFSSKQIQNKQEQRRNMEYLNNLAEIPTTAKTIIEQGGIKYIQNFLKEENKESKKVHLVNNDGIEDHVYNLTEGHDEQEEEDEIHAESREEELKKEENLQDTYNTQVGGSKEPSNPVEILRKLIQNHTDELKKFINQEVIQEVLKYLRLQAHSKEAVFATLRVLQSCAEEDSTLAILNENKALESIFIALNQHPTDSDICGLSGLILNKLGAEQLASDVKDQYEDMGNSFNPKDEDMIEGIRQANIYLSNLLTCFPSEEDDDLITKNKTVIQALDKMMRKGLPQNFMASFLLLIIRLCNQGEETKLLIRESNLPQKVIDFMLEESKNIESSRLIEFCMEGLYCMIGGGSSENLLNTLDPESGQDIEVESSETKKEYLEPIDKLLNSKPVISMIASQLSLQQRENFNTSKQTSAKIFNRIQRSQQLLSRLIECDPVQFNPIIQEILSEEKVIGLWTDLIQEDRNNALKSTAFLNMGRLISNLAQNNQQFFLKFSNQTQMNYVIETLLNIKINQDFINNVHEQITLKNAFSFLQKFIDNTFDKSRLVNANIPSVIFKVFQRLASLSTSDFETSGLICLLFKQICELIEIGVEDSIIGHDLTKFNLISVIINFLQKFSSADQEKTQLEDDSQNTEDVISSEGLLERAIESCYKLLNTSLNQSKFSAYTSKIYGPQSPIVQVSCVNKISAYSLVKTLQVLYSLIICYDPSSAIIFAEPFNEIKEKNKFSSDLKIVQTVVTQYPKIPIIKILYQDITQIQNMLLADDLKGLHKIRDQIYGNLLIEDKIEEEIKGIAEKVEQYAEQVKKEQVDKDEKKEIMFEDLKNDDQWEANITNPNLDVLKILDKISHALEKFALGIISNGEYTQDQENLIIKLLETVKSITVDDNTALKVHKMGITDNLLNLLITVDKFSDHFASLIAGTLSHLTKFTKALKKVENEIEFNDTILLFLSYVLEDYSKNPSIQTLQKYKKTTLEVLDTMKNVTAVESNISKIVKNKGVQQCILLFEKSLDIIEVLVKTVDILDKLSHHNKEALELCATKITPYINAYCEKHFSSAESIMGFALLGGTLCRDTDSQNKPTNCFYALSGLAYNNKVNCEAIMNTDILTVVKEQIKEFISEHQVIETICSLLSNLTFKNEDVKKRLGEVGVVDLLGKIFSHYANQRVLSSKTTKQVLRAIGNSSLTIDNATRIVKSNFVGLSSTIIEKMKFEEEGDVLRYCIDVIGNLASHPENVNHANTEDMFKDGVLDLIIKVINKNSLNTEIITSCIDALDGLIQNKLISVVVAESDTISIIMKIIKSQNWNEGIVVKCTKVLANISGTKQNIDQLQKYELPLFIGNLLKNLQKPNDKIINYCFRILNRIAAEKAKEKQMLQSGLIEALGEGLSHSQVNTDCLFNYISLLKSMAKLPNAVQLIGDKSVGNAILRANENKNNEDIVGVTLILIERLIKCKSAVANIIENGGFDFLMFVAKNKIHDLQLCVIALDSMRNIVAMDEKYRQQALCYENDITSLAIKAKDSTLNDRIRQCLFALLNQKDPNYIIKQNSSSQEEIALTQDQKEFLVNGVNVKLYRVDGSYKNAIVCLDNELKIIYAFKKGGKQKNKYKFGLTEITDYKFNYAEKNKVWELSIFSKAGGIFIKKPHPELCCSIYGPTANNERKSICFETADVEIKKKFEKAFLIAQEVARQQAEQQFNQNK